MPSRSNLEATGARAYGTPIRPAIRTGAPVARNTVGEADPATRRKMLDQRLTERQPASSNTAPERRQKREPETGVTPNAARLLRDRGRQIDKEVNDRS